MQFWFTKKARHAGGLLTRLARNRRANVLPIMAAALVPIVGGMGAAIDASRVIMVKSQLQTGVDAAALAGARAFAITDGSANSRTSQVDSYFYINFPGNPNPYMGVSNLQLTPTFTTVNNINVTTVTASATVPMTFMQLFNYQSQTVTAIAKAEIQPRPLEVMMVLDNTGSMRANLSAGRTRMTALKEAANDFVDIVHQGQTRRADLAIGFVPYDITVNVGRLLPSGSVASQTGFNDAFFTTNYGDWPANFLAWKGCVMNDSTVKDVSADRLESEPGAWDVTRTLPGEGSNPAVQPYFVPPMYVPRLASSSANATQKANKDGDYYKIANVEPKNNLYKLDGGSAGAAQSAYLLATPTYRKYFYDYYIGLNNGANTATDDVIRKTDGSYYTPGSADAWVVDLSRVPFYSNTAYWMAPTSASINANGGRVDDITKDTTPMPSPNWQCPEEAMPIAYNRPKSDYTSYISDKNSAIYPANGTIHHAGLLWGYRLLVRDDKFPRTNPTNERARRAIVFMTDGLNEVGESQNGYTDRTFTWYGQWSQSSLSSNAANTETQMLRRFAKTCANIQRETNPPEIYIIALVANSTEVNTAFDQCAPGRVYRTSSTAELRTAFQNVAAELVDLHLTQ
ncbi:pilus assembly protein TadG-related protein [Sphingomonas sp. BGYR3]|uniref:TadE/TadG family type IV pilus assembly protein n=1 Tax=Sphingomonas sp. BGYR3 TaxID=2975483 RepID=UPI0021A685D5|nr:pilus assembly protein TadG-related protein [Sphingomonas sp. BGYR3]MDG5487478.1 pilus assembly protein TadG-related protein [Sphingomonas sp. BGYR3]